MSVVYTAPTTEAWEKRWHEKSKKWFYFNSATNERTWDRPNAFVKTQPSPPSPLPSPAKAKDKDKAKEKSKSREADQWCKIDDGTGKGRMIWYNQVTEAKQYDVPECRVKYRK